MSRLLLLVVGLAACGFEHGRLVGNNNEIDAPASCMSWDAHHFSPCELGAPSPDLDLDSASGYTYDTTAGTLVENGGAPIAHASAMIAQGDTPAWIMNVASLRVRAGVTVAVVGDKPLIVAAWDRIRVEGAIDAGSKLQKPGAGANPAACAANAASPGVEDATGGGGSGGGGGGAFRGAGGLGGPGDAGAENAGGAGGMATAAPAIVRGGCSGAASGRAGPSFPTDPTAIAVGGAGGGAIQLTAQVRIEVSGMVIAGGGGGGGAPQGSAAGGGGGGAGGFVGLDAPSIVLDGAVLAANGGAGGTSNNFAGGADPFGHPGEDGRPNATQAAGGVSTSLGCALDGASGAAGAVIDGPAAAQTAVSCGGAGGGGGVGYVLTWHATPMKTSSPIISPDDQAGPP